MQQKEAHRFQREKNPAKKNDIQILGILGPRSNNFQVRLRLAYNECGTDARPCNFLGTWNI